MDNIFDTKEQFGEDEPSLRPLSLDDYIGQDNIKDSLRVYIKSALMRKEPLDHILLYGPPGLGKTTLATIIANEMGAHIHYATGPSIEKAGDLVAILSNLSDNEILFIDEIHRIPRFIEEILYTAMEDYRIDIMIGKDNASRCLSLDLPKFTLIGATTRAGNLSSPLRDRFGIIYHLEYYNVNDLIKICSRTSRVLNVEIKEEAKEIIALSSRGTPRICNRLFKRVRDFALVLNDGIIDLTCTNKAFKHLKITKKGLDDQDLKYLDVLINIYGGGPVGIDALAAQMGLDKDTLLDVYEPYLLKESYIRRTNRGREATKKAFLTLKKEE